MGKSKIEWTKSTWNPIVGCRKVSPGCANCYAETMAKRLKAMGVMKYCQGVVDENGWTGKTFFSASELHNFPRKKPTVIFVCSMGDLYHHSVEPAAIHSIYSIMAQYPQHTVIILTKRPERIVPVLYDSGYLQKGETLENVWHLTSVENQEWADRRIPELLKLKEYGDWKIGLSIEPLLGPVDLNNISVQIPNSIGIIGGTCLGQPNAHHFHPTNLSRDKSGIFQLIIGCESGPKRRECKREWILDLIEQGKEAGVPTFVKQVPINGKVSHDPAEWPEGLRVRELAWAKE